MTHVDTAPKIFFSLLAIISLAGCASIQDFTASPRTACPGEPVLLTWDVSVGQAKLEASTALDGLGLKAPKGQQNFSPATNTRFILKADALLTSEQRELDVVIIPAFYTTAFGEKALCTHNEPTVSFVLSTTVSAQSRVLLVKNPYARALIIAKDGIEVELAPRAETDRFKNISVLGSWSIRARVAQNESCDAALTSVGNRLLFHAELACAGQ